MPLFRVENDFLSDISIHPKIRPLKNKKNTSNKHLKNTSKLGGGCNNW